MTILLPLWYEYSCMSSCGVSLMCRIASLVGKGVAVSCMKGVMKVVKFVLSVCLFISVHDYSVTYGWTDMKFS